MHLLLTQRGVMAQQRGGGQAAGAGAEHVDVFAAGDGGHHVNGFFQCFDIGRQAPLAVRLGRVAPAHHEGLHAIAQQEARNALFRRQVEYVKLVDLRRYHQQWALMHLLSDRLVLDQLQQIVAENHRTIGGGQAFADLEGVHVDLAGHAAVVDHVLGQVRQAVEQALAAGFEEAFDCGRVGHAVAGGHGFGHQVDHEVATAGILFGQVAVLNPVMQFLAPGQVGLQVTAVQRILAPRRVGKAPIAVGGGEVGLAEQHVLQLHADVGKVFAAVHGLLEGLLEYDSGGAK